MCKIGVIIGAYDRDVKYVGELGRSLKTAGYYVVLAYDAQSIAPDIKTINSCHYFVSGGGHLPRPAGHLRNMKRGHRILYHEGCQYSMCITGDAVIEEPEKIVDLIDILGDNNVIASQWKQGIGTMIYFGKTWMLHNVFRIMPDGITQNEKKFRRAMNELGGRAKICPCTEGDKGIWGDIGFWRRHGHYMPA